MPRSFISIEIEEEIKNRLTKIQNELVRTGADLKLVEPENIHLTLRFLGDVPEDDLTEIKSAIQDSKKVIGPFKLQVKGMGVFPKPSYIRVIWAGVGNGSDETTAIRKSLDQNLTEIDYPPDRKDYTPHLTIARVKTGKNKDSLNEIVNENSEEDFGSCMVNGIELKESELTPEGPIYSTIEKFEFD
ncbi:MAG: RNA 2',3'-cyclic phosphodiesterase [Hadesarchaea archaeon]|nr:RNA 2',3'-cyclic phosphodiesterase [Hadesarchaea archaeon]